MTERSHALKVCLTATVLGLGLPAHLQLAAASTQAALAQTPSSRPTGPLEPSPANPAPLPGIDEPLALISRLYRPLCTPGDDLSWPLKIESASASVEKFSTSTREIFYRWATSACADWVADTGAYVQCHGDVHPGNTGSYVADLTSQQLAVGLKDFDESVAMPFQIDLLQAVVAMRYGGAGKGDNAGMSDDTAAAGVRAMLRGYRDALDTGRGVSELLVGSAIVEELLEPGDAPLRAAVDDFVEGGRFKRVIRTKKGAVKEVLRPALRTDDLAPAADAVLPGFSKSALAAAMVRAVEVSPGLARVVGPQSQLEWENAIEDAAFRTRLGSGGSQGMLKMLVLVRGGVVLKAATAPGEARPTVDAIFYFKQASRSAAQRAGFVAPDDLSGGRRVTGGAAVLTRPAVDATGWCDLGGYSFVVSVRNPWEREPDLKWKDPQQIEDSARYLGVLLGVAHTNAAGGVPQARRLRDRAGIVLEKVLLERSAAFMQKNAKAFDVWSADKEVARLRATAKAALKSAGEK